MSVFDLLCIGDSAIDEFMQVETGLVGGPVPTELCFMHGSKIPVEHFSTHIAGNACNVAVGCTLLGMSVGIYTEVGDDSNGDKVLSELKKLGVNTDLSHVVKGANTNVHAVIVTQGERTIFSYHEKRNYGLEIWPKTQWIFYSSLAKGFESFQSKMVGFLSENPSVGLVFNPGTMQMQSGLDSLRPALEVTDILFVNEVEAEILSAQAIAGDQSAHIKKLNVADYKAGPMTEAHVLELHKNMMKLGPKLTVITLGGYGSCAYDGKEFIKMPVYRDKSGAPVVNTTGAGDAYSSGFLSAIFYKKSLKEAMMWGSINSSGVIKHSGSTSGLYTKKDLEKLI